MIARLASLFCRTELWRPLEDLTNISSLNPQSSPYGFQSDGQVNPDVEIEEDDPGHHHCHQQLQVLPLSLKN